MHSTPLFDNMCDQDGYLTILVVLSLFYSDKINVYF